MTRSSLELPCRDHHRLLAGAAACMVAVLAAIPVAAQTMTVTGSPGSLRIVTAVAGSNPTLVTEATTKYGTNTALTLGTSRITAWLNSPMPAGVTLTITLAAQSGATSMGEVTLSTTAQSVVTNIPGLTSANNLTITYRLSATSAAGVISASSRTVTLTIGA